MSDDKHLRSIPDFGGNAAVLERLREAREPVVMIRPGKAAVVLFTMEEYKRRNADRDLPYSLVQGEAETGDD